jgi:hypothetical protein
VRIRPDELRAIQAGDLDLAFRRWERPRVVVGTLMRTAVGLIEVTSVDPVEADDLDERDARRAGAASVEALRAGLAARPDQPAWRVGLRFAGPDPRVALRESVPDAAEVETIRARLDRLDRASKIGPWTRTALDLIDRNPGRRAPDLAAQVGRPTAEFKTDVRKLKELGLTESLDIGYRLSPRGATVVDAERRAAGGRARRRAPQPEGTPLPKVGASASRALRAAGLVTLEDVATRREADLAALHGVGPIAITTLREALAAHGLDFTP